MKKAVVVIGRMQPVTLGHISLIDAIKRDNPGVTPVVALIKRDGARGTDNPFPSKIIVQLINRATTGVKVIEVQSADVTKIADTLKTMGYIFSGLYCGEDRAVSYRRQVDGYKSKHDNIADDAFVKLFPRMGGFVATISATKVRNALKAGNFPEYSKMMARQLATKEVFQYLKNYL